MRFTQSQYIQNILKLVVLSKIYQSHARLMVMDHPCASLQKYPKSPLHTYKVKGLYQWYLLTIHTYLCLHNIENIIELLQNLGFTIHPTKSILTPTQRITFLGFVTDSVQMTLEITEEKKNKIHNLCLEILQKEKITLRILASVISSFVASFPAVPLGPL